MKLYLLLFVLTLNSSTIKTIQTNNNNSTKTIETKNDDSTLSQKPFSIKIKCSSEKASIPQLKPLIDKIIEEWDKIHKTGKGMNKLISNLKDDKKLIIMGKIEEPQSIKKVLIFNFKLLKSKFDELSVCIPKLSSDLELFKNEKFNSFRTLLLKVYIQLSSIFKELKLDLDKIRIKYIRRSYKTLILDMNLFIEGSLKVKDLNLSEKSSKIDSSSLNQDDLRKKEISSQLKQVLKS